MLCCYLLFKTSDSVCFCMPILSVYAPFLVFQDDFAENPGRKWLNAFLHSSNNEENHDEAGPETESEVMDPVQRGKFIDTFRYFHPTRTNAFTCWSTLTGARQTNYGTRIDYIFANCRLVTEQFVAADIMPEVEGSDHCPVWAQLNCPLLPSYKPPPLCTRYLPEFVGKQQKLSLFLVKVDQKQTRLGQKNGLPGSQEEEERRENLNPVGVDKISGKKRSLTSDSAVPKGKKTKTANTSVKPQGNLLSFFKPKPTDNKPCEKASTTGFDGSAQLCSSSATVDTGQPVKTNNSTSQPTVGQSDVRKSASLGFWKSVLHGPPPPPSCKAHREPCVLRTVKKEGPNVGKQFFVCCRPQGHASNPEARCNFFAWVDKGK